MKKHTIIAILILQILVSYSQDTLNKNSIFINIGRYNQNYFYGVYDFGYRNDELFRKNIGFYSRTRIYFSRASYFPQFDLTFIPTYTFNNINKIKLNVGLGFDARIREIYYAKNYGIKSSIEPIIYFNEIFIHSKVYLDVEQWLHFYSDGLSLDLIPMIGYKIKRRIAIYIRPEFRYLKKYNSNSEWYNTYYIGFKYIFKNKTNKV